MFNKLGRSNPSKNCRVFSESPKNFYKLDPLTATYAEQHSAVEQKFDTGDRPSLLAIEDCLLEIKNEIENNYNYENLFEGTAIPFCMSIDNPSEDLGTKLEKFWLPLLKKEFERQCPGSYFKATLQGNFELKQSLSIAKDTGYDTFLEAGSNSSIVGYYFPTALQEFDIESQRRKIAKFPKFINSSICLSGPFEIIYSLICYPKLLHSKENYSPILCASALEHDDPRMVMIFKSYGPHLEFWLLSQMLTPTKTQVSEQWSGGLTVFKPLQK